DVDDGRQAIEVILGPLRPAAAPAELGAVGHVVHAGGAVPGGAAVPFHVGVVGEQLALRAEGEVVGVTQTAGDRFDEAAVGVGAEDRAARRGNADGVAPRIFVLRQDEIA